MSIGSLQKPLRISKRNLSFREKVKALSGENIELCFQCGACSSCCPMTERMDLLPSTVMRLVQLGVEEVLNSGTMWVCSSCFTCTVRCPRGIDVSRVMEALRQMVLRRNVDRVDLDSIPRGELREIPQIALISCLRKFTA